MLTVVGVYVEVNSWNNYIRVTNKIILFGVAGQRLLNVGQPAMWEEPRLLSWMAFDF